MNRRVARRLAFLGLALLGASGVGAWLALRDRGPAILRPLRRGRDPRFAERLIPGRPQFPHAERLSAREATIVALAEAYERIDREDRADVGAWVDLHERLLWLGEWPGAERGARALLDVDPAFPPGLALLSGIRFFTGNWEEGTALAEWALAGAPDLPLALVSRARMAAARGDRDAADADLRRAVEIDPRRPEAAFYLGILLAAENRFSEAAPYLRRAREHQPDPDWPIARGIRRLLELEDLLGGRRPHRVSGPDEVEVPMALRAEVPAVWVRLDGGIEGWFIIDSGTHFCVIAPHAAKGARIAPPDRAVGSGTSSAKAALIPRMEIGALSIHDAPAVLEERGVSTSDPTVLGLLGVSLLREFEVTIDTLRGRARFSPPSREPPAVPSFPERGARTSCLIVEGRPFVRVRFGDGPEHLFLFDTAAAGLLVDARLAREELRIAPDSPPARRINVTGPAGRAYVAGLYPVPRPLVIAGLSLDGLEAQIDPGPGSRFGLNHPQARGIVGLLRPGRTTINLSLQLITLETGPP